MNDFYLELRRAWFYGQAAVEKVIAEHDAALRAAIEGGQE